MTLTEPMALTLLYTAALEGRIDLLPRLLTRVKAERAAIGGPTLLIDLGLSCTADAWICRATGGRGMLVAMDGMGYDAFHIGPQDVLYTMPELVNQIRGIVATPFAAGPWNALVSRAGAEIVLVNGARFDSLFDAPIPEAGAQTRRPDLLIGLRLTESADEPTIRAAGRAAQSESAEPQRLLLVDGGRIAPNSGPLLGRIDVVLLPDPPYISVAALARLDLPPDLPPDPTMSGVIEFVEGEARFAERKRGGA